MPRRFLVSASLLIVIACFSTATVNCAAEPEKKQDASATKTYSWRTAKARKIKCPLSKEEEELEYKRMEKRINNIKPERVVKLPGGGEKTHKTTYAEYPAFARNDLPRGYIFLIIKISKYRKGIDRPVWLYQDLSSLLGQLQDEPKLFPDEMIPLLEDLVKAHRVAITQLGARCGCMGYLDFIGKLGTRGKSLLPMLDKMAEDLDACSIYAIRAAKKIRAAK